MGKRANPEINAGSMADIAFLLLIFFLVTTTMDVDTGISRKLPPPVDPMDQTDIKIKDRNVMKILVNSHDALLVDGKPGDIANLRAEARDFFKPHPNNPEYPETDVKSIGSLGNIYTSKGVVSLKSARGTSYEMYIAVQNELAAAVNELRDELARNKFGKSYEKLTDEEQIKAINKAYPMKISEAEPEKVGGE